jgi:dTDP-glucose 4,6-dehydratase
MSRRIDPEVFLHKRAVKTERVLVTGGAGFIGSALVRRLIRGTNASVLTVDKLTYAGHLSTLEDAFDDPRHRFEQEDVCDAGTIRSLFAEFRPTTVMHLAAESHVDRSIDSAAEFVRTNVVGTATMLEEARRYWRSLAAPDSADFRFLHVSTDEVYGSLEEGRSSPKNHHTSRARRTRRARRRPTISSGRGRGRTGCRAW